MCARAPVLVVLVVVVGVGEQFGRGESASRGGGGEIALAAITGMSETLLIRTAI